MESANKRANNMSDYIASLNAPLTSAPEPTAEFDDANLFATTDFFNFDFNEAGSAGDSPESLKNTKFPSWSAQSSSGDFLSPDFQFNSSTGVTTSNGFPVDVNALNAAKRKHAELNDPSLPVEERSRMAAEEDKRRRNTAASARFRVKKKQREQALEKTAKDMTDKANRLEKRVNELEMENRWLKGLITDKNEGGEDKLSEMFAKLKEEIGEKGLDALADSLNVDS